MFKGRLAKIIWRVSSKHGKALLNFKGGQQTKPGKFKGSVGNSVPLSLKGAWELELKGI